jgi:hypothetical protein
MNDEDLESTSRGRHISEIEVWDDWQNMLSRRVVVKPKELAEYGLTQRVPLKAEIPVKKQNSLTILAVTGMVLVKQKFAQAREAVNAARGSMS